MLYFKTSQIRKISPRKKTPLANFSPNRQLAFEKVREATKCMMHMLSREPLSRPEKHVARKTVPILVVCHETRIPASRVSIQKQPRHIAIFYRAVAPNFVVLAKKAVEPFKNVALDQIAHRLPVRQVPYVHLQLLFRGKYTQTNRYPQKVFRKLP